MSKDDKFDYLNPGQLFRFPFTVTSLQWGVTIGALLACHKYNRIRQWREAAFFGVVAGFVVTSASWAYYMFQFSKETHILRRQSQLKAEHARRSEYVKTYFREKYQLQDLKDEELETSISYFSNIWDKHAKDTDLPTAQIDLKKEKKV